MRKKGSAVEQLTEFNKAGMLERSRHARKGYTAEHDAEHGVDHLLMWAQLYLAQGEVYKGWSLIQAARDLIAKNDPPKVAPWNDPAGCFGHCDPEGWYSPCVSKSQDND